MNLNPQFVEMIKGYGSESLSGLVEALSSTEPPVSIRINRGKGLSAPAACEPVPWAARGWYLRERPSFTLDPAFHQGRYYVQEASSMVVGEIVSRLVAGSDAPLRYLDACAAPGGKTTAVIDALPAGSLVVANEYVARRASILVENLTKWGSPDTVVSRGDTHRFGKLKGVFDIVGVDAPCSGEGMFRKDEEAVSQWSPGLVSECAERQREILGNVWPSLRAGGYLIYSTCTFNRRENEEMVDWLVNELGAESADMSLPEEWGIAAGIDTPHHCYRFLPHRLKGEGLFVAVVRKSGGDGSCRLKPAKPPKPDKAVASLANWILDPDGCVIERDGDCVVAYARHHADVIAALRQSLDVVSTGIKIAEVKGCDFLPTQSLAMSLAFNPAAFTAVDVDAGTALTYLRRESVTLPDGTPKGYVLLTCEGQPLGFVKNLGNRSNNLYPAAWRILKR